MLDLFSGIGGFSLAASWTGGIETVAFCEIEPYCQKVLHKHWPDVPIYPDIKQLRGEDIGSVDIVCGGFPCQPFSCAGKQRGKEDDRYLWPEMFRVIQETKPTWVVGENVAGLIELGLEDCFFNLEAEGYEVQALIIPACAIGAPHRRDRVWILAHSRCSLRQGSILERAHEDEAGERDANITERPSSSPELDVADTESRKSGEQESRNRREGIGRGSEKVIDVADTESKQGTADINGKARTTEKGEPRRSGGCIRFDWWQSEPSVGRVANGIPNRVDRLKCLGNAIVPQVAYPILQGIVDIENN
jgi:DNA (cytosine-5)-methyltransferase 1